MPGSESMSRQSFVRQLGDILDGLKAHDRSTIILDLADFGSFEVSGVIEEAIKDGPYGLRLAGAYSLTLLGETGPDMKQILEHALTLNAEPEYQVLSAAALARTNHQAAKDTLRRFSEESDWYIITLALDTLCAIGDRQTIEKMKRDLSDPDVALIAASSLAQTGDPFVLPTLMEFVEHGATFEKCRALRSLGRVADASCKRTIERCCTDADPSVRRSAYLALALLAPGGTEQQQEALLRSWNELKDSRNTEL